MLEAHFLVPGQRITSYELAAAAGYTDFRAANKIYSNLGRKFREKLGIPRQPSAIRASSFVNVVGRARDTGYWVFELKPAVTRALRQLRWFDDSQIDAPTDDVLPAKIAAVEGGSGRSLGTHRYREASLRRAKLRSVLQADGKLMCEVPGCEFDFAVKYGALGEHFAEVHHLEPLGADDQPRVTRLDRLAIVCSNCHSMIHRDGVSRTLAEISEAIRARSNKRLQPSALGEIVKRRG
jgi:predicted HNH restriction endonuclease